MERLYTSSLTAEIGDHWFPLDQVYVSVKSSEINKNNIVAAAPYSITEVDGQPFCIPDLDPKKKMCDLCFRQFSGWSQLYSHQAKLCYLEPITVAHPLKLSFGTEQLVYIEDIIRGTHREVHREGERFVVICDKAHIEIFLRQLYTGQVTKYNIEHWYPNLAQLKDTVLGGVTADTIFLSLSDDDLKLIQSLSKSKLAENMGMERRLTNDELENQNRLADRISEQMRVGKKYFCRFSTRSPKDGASVPREGLENLDPVQKLQRKLDLLCVKNGDEVVEIITRSQRIFSDINFYFQYRVPNSSSSHLCLILRDFMNDLPVDHEFRCFSKNRKITAISQYYCYHKWDSLKSREHVERCRDAIVAFHEKIKSHIPLSDYVIDVVVYPDYSCHVIELNPFGAAMSSGSALFHWLKGINIFSRMMGWD
eukprot:TRINITY_DN3811_c0_g1_i1.p1 TRINITY_DN3811_c0_g1~~TRINITY_DN3811_c0_g1_i1.p1  ORF type:complete len:423 (-),score=90.52 TRINITY_DN3811_c0_g1_i1:141-1409(-)